jgi:uncharacterized protein
VIARDGAGPGPVIRGFAGTGFRIDDQVYAAAILTPDAVAAWTPPPLAELTRDALAAALAIGPEFILLGTGAALTRPPRALVAALEADGVGVEAMDSRAAARAWGVLRAEGRRIAAALYPL